MAEEPVGLADADAIAGGNHRVLRNISYGAHGPGTPDARKPLHEIEFGARSFVALNLPVGAALALSAGASADTTATRATLDKIVRLCICHLQARSWGHRRPWVLTVQGPRLAPVASCTQGGAGLEGSSHQRRQWNGGLDRLSKWWTMDSPLKKFAPA